MGRYCRCYKQENDTGNHQMNIHSGIDSRNHNTSSFVHSVSLTGINEQSATERFISITEEINDIRESRKTIEEKYELLVPYSLNISELINQKLNQYDISHHSSQQGQAKHAVVMEVAKALSTAYLDFSLHLANDINSNSSVLIDCLFNGMYFASKTIIYSYYFLQKAPTGIWINLHRLYILADNGHIQNVTPSSTFEINCNLNTIELLYKSLLIFSTLDPYGFRISTLHKIYSLTKLYSSLLTIDHINTNDNVIYVIDRMNIADRPPVKISTEKNDNQDLYYLDFNKIISRMDALIDKIKSSGKVNNIFTEVELSLPLFNLDKINKTWKTFNSRRHERVQCNIETIACFGLSNIFKVLSMPDERVIEELNAEKDVNSFTSSIIDGSSILLKGVIENQSESGFLLKLKNDEVAKKLVGEIVALKKLNSSGNETWRIGVVRWVYHLSENNNSLGIELLVNEPNIALVKYVGLSSQAEYPALITNESLYVFNEIFIPGQVIKVSDLVDDFKIILSNSIVISALYTQFPYVHSK